MIKFVDVVECTYVAILKRTHCYIWRKKFNKKFLIKKRIVKHVSLHSSLRYVLTNKKDVQMNYIRPKDQATVFHENINPEGALKI